MSDVIGISWGASQSALAIPEERAGEGFLKLDRYPGASLLRGWDGTPFIGTERPPSPSGATEAQPARSAAGPQTYHPAIPLKRIVGGGLSTEESRWPAGLEAELTEQFRHFRALAEHRLQRMVRHAVIALPYLFSAEAKNLVRQAALAVGWSEVELIPEPAAAVRAWALQDPRDSLRVFTCDVGAGKTEFAIVEKSGTRLTVRYAWGNMQLGGYDVDRRLADWLLGQLTTQGVRLFQDRDSHNPQDHPEVVALLRLCEQAKIALSTEEAHTFPPALATLQETSGHPVRSDVTITRREFERLIAPDISRVLDLCRQAAAAPEIGKIDEVLLVGGGTLLPLLARQLGEILGREVRQLDPVLPMALGAAQWAPQEVPLPLAATCATFASKELAVPATKARETEPSEVRATSTLASAMPVPTGVSASRAGSRNIVFVGNLASGTVKKELRDHFSRAGLVKSLRLFPPKLFEGSGGFAWVEFSTHADALKAAEMLHNKEFHGRRLHVIAMLPDTELSSSPSRPFSSTMRQVDLTFEALPSFRPMTILQTSGVRSEIRAASEQPPNKPLHMDDNVRFTVFRPNAVRPDEWYPLLAFAHLTERRPDAPPDEPDPIAEVRRKASQKLGALAVHYEAMPQDSRAAVRRDGLLTFVPEVPGLEFNPPSRSCFWKEPVHQEEFRFRASAQMLGQTGRGRLTVFLGNLILAEVNLSIRVDAQAAKPRPDLLAEEEPGRPYRKLFASYSRRDEPIVLDVVNHVAATGDVYLRDLVDLRSGEVWSEQLQSMIQQADIFQLFWSRNSMKSAFVRQEWEFALAQGRRNFVRPVYWEEPLPEEPAADLPPEALRQLHFQRIRVTLPASGLRAAQNAVGVSPKPETSPGTAAEPPDAASATARSEPARVASSPPTKPENPVWPTSEGMADLTEDVSPRGQVSVTKGHVEDHLCHASPCQASIPQSESSEKALSPQRVEPKSSATPGMNVSSGRTEVPVSKTQSYSEPPSSVLPHEPECHADVPPSRSRREGGLVLSWLKRRKARMTFGKTLTASPAGRHFRRRSAPQMIQDPAACQADPGEPMLDPDARQVGSRGLPICIWRWGLWFVIFLLILAGAYWLFGGE